MCIRDRAMVTWRLYCKVANPVPQMDAPLLVPNSVAGGADGNTANKAGTRINPPPPTIESTKPAKSEAAETSSNSMGGVGYRKTGVAGARAPGSDVHDALARPKCRVL